MPIPDYRIVKPSLFKTVLLILVLSTMTARAQAAEALPKKVTDGIDTAVTEVLEETGVPSASVAVVHDGKIALTKAYGMARLDPPTPATTIMRYPIGSISKQFTAAAVVMLAEAGKLSLDDTVDRFFPDLTRAGDITLRQLLSHTAGIRDYWPQDYVPPAMLEPVTTEELIDRWARRPLDFEPGSTFQYSNTGFVIAGAIVEKVSGETLPEFLRERIFAPLGMDSVTDIDQGSLTPDDATGYQRFGLGPPRPAPKEGKGWLFAAGPLAMTAEDLAKWNLSLIEGRVPEPAVTRELTREAVLGNGVGTGYGLGLAVALDGNRRVVGHGGEVSGFTAVNRVYPEERAAIVVLVNQDAADAARTIAGRIAEQLFVGNSPADAEMLARVSEILDGLRKGKIDRSLFTPNANHYFSEAALEDIRAGLRRLGPPKEITQTRHSLRGGLTTRVYRAVFKKKTLRIVTRAAPDGKLEQYTLSVE
jgi:CubicO group peptidase (beta-lactamase class C family)